MACCHDGKAGLRSRPLLALMGSDGQRRAGTQSRPSTVAPSSIHMVRPLIHSPHAVSFQKSRTRFVSMIQYEV